MARPRGRPSTFTPDACQRFIQATSLGAKRELAAGAAGWSRTTALRFLSIGEDADAHTEDHGGRLTDTQREYREFWRAVKQAESQHAQGMMACIVQAARSGTWQAAAWMLERIYPELYGRRIQEIQGKDGGPIHIDTSAAELLKLLDRIPSREEQPVRKPVNDPAAHLNGDG